MGGIGSSRCGARRAAFAGVLGFAVVFSALSSLSGKEFDPETFFEMKAKEVAQQQAKRAVEKPQTVLPLSGGSSAITNFSHGMWVVLGIGAGLAAIFIVIWIKAPPARFESRVDDHIDREFREMIHETGEDPFGPEETAPGRRRDRVGEESVIEDLTGRSEE